MRVDRKTRKIEDDTSHHVARLASDAGQCDQVVEVARHFTVEAFDQGSGHSDEVLCFRCIETGRTHEFLDARHVGVSKVIGRREFGEQRGRHHVHAGIGALCRKDRGGEQFEGVAVIEFATGLGKLDGEAFCDDFRT
ncbi:MAG: hypothetical protein RIQ64_2059 [Actinomycetota bacterium]